MLFDSHCHIDDSRFSGDREEVVRRAEAGGVTGLINIGADLASSARSVGLAEKYPGIYAAVGFHPHDAKDAREEHYEQIYNWTKQPKVVAVGEIGLDYYYNHSPKEVQQAAFIRQLDLARQACKPVIIHDRDAHGDILSIIKKEGRGLTGVFHCFSGGLEMAREVIRLGFYISIAGPVTFQNAVKLKEVARDVPLDRLLVETDSPYLTPHPYRGRRNEPVYVRYVTQKVAGLRGMAFEDLARATTENVKRLFDIKN